MSEIHALLRRINRALAAIPVLQKKLDTPAPASRTRRPRRSRAMPGVIQLAFSDLAIDQDQDQAG